MTKFIKFPDYDIVFNVDTIETVFRRDGTFVGIIPKGGTMKGAFERDFKTPQASAVAFRKLCLDLGISPDDCSSLEH